MSMPVIPPANVRIVVSPALVQGKGAAAEIARAIGILEAWGEADVLVVGRGGGSIEDLWAFNEEAVAYAIAAAKTPVVSAVGHETDFTIADFVADARAATPSEAAERIAPDQRQLRGRIAHAGLMLRRALAGLAREQRERLRGAARARLFRQPMEMLQMRWQRIDENAGRFAGAAEARLRRLENRRDVAAARLAGLSPLKALERGYAVVLDGQGKAVTDAATLRPGARMTARVHRGSIDAVVEQVRQQGEQETTRALF